MYDLLRALESASYDILRKTGGTICYGLWDLRVLISQKRRRGTTCCGQLGSASCDITHYDASSDIPHEIGYELLRALGSSSCDITHETGSTIFYRHWFLRLVITYKRDRGYELLRAFGSASCDLTYETRGTICYRHWVLSCDITHETGGTICSGHWVLRLVKPHTRQGVRFFTGIGFCAL